MKILKKSMMGLAASLAAVATGMPAALAQEGARVLEEVVVTARKKQESMQDVPVAVSAVSRESVEAAFMMDSTALTQFAPNIVFDNISAGAPGGGGISIRGISFQDVEKTFDPAVLMYVDDIALGTNTGNVMNMLDVDRIEVLRGPQGTLFGKNAVGGVIHIHRIKPVLGQWAGKARVRLGTYDRRDVEGVLNVPLGEDLAMKLSAARLEQDEGFYKNVAQGGREGDSKEERFGVHFLWNPLETLTAEFQYNNSESDGTVVPMLAINSEQATFCAAFGVCRTSENKPFSGDRREGAGTLDQDYFLDTEDYTLKASWDLAPSLTGVLIYGRREIDDAQDIDFDGSPRRLFHARRSSEYVQDSVEARFDYDGGGPLSVTGGYYFWNAETNDWVNNAEFPLLLGLSEDGCGFSVSAPDCQIQRADAESESHSFFFEGDYRLTEHWVLTAGARWIKEQKLLIKSADLPVFGVEQIPETRGSRTDIDTIHRLGIRYESAKDLMAYLTYSSGFRSGGFSIRGQTPEVLQKGYEPETVDNIEAGVKTTVWDGRVRVNATVFNMDYKDMQQELNIPGGPSGQQDTVVNASEATLRGVELEFDALVTDNIRVDFNAGYLDAEYDDFFGSLYSDGIERDLSHLPLRRAPEWNYTLGVNDLRDIGPGELISRVSYNWRDDYAGTATDFPGTHIDAFGTLDASVSYSWDQWRVAAFGRNLTDEDEYNHTFVVRPGIDGSSLFTFATPRAPTTFGVELTYTFGSY